MDFSLLLWYIVCYQAKEVTRMAKITIEELYRGEKYDIMSAVTAKALQLGIDERTEEGRTWIEMELVRQTVIAIEQMKKNGDCIAEGELGMRSPFPYKELLILVEANKRPLPLKRLKMVEVFYRKLLIYKGSLT